MADLKNTLWRRITVNINGSNRDLPLLPPQKKEKQIHICYSCQVKLFLASITKILLSYFQASSH